MENTSPPNLKIFLLGKFQVCVNGVFIDDRLWTRRSPKSLIKLLALQPNHRLHREQIIDLLWTEQDLQAALNSLNKAIHAVRRTLEPKLSKGSQSRFLQTKNQQVVLCSPGELFVDVEEFERRALIALKTQNVEFGESALALYKGQLLTEDIYEDWLSAKRESLYLLYRKVTNKTAEIYIQKNEHQRALELLKKLCHEDPTDERIHQNLMRLYALTGSRYQALKQYDHCRSAMIELGMEPEKETVKLRDLIKAGKIPTDKSRFTENVPLRPASLSTQTHSYNLDETSSSFKVQREQILPKIKQLTFHQEVIHAARFDHNQQAIFYSAVWENKESRTYKINRENFKAQAVGMNGAGIYSVSPNGSLALGLHQRFIKGYIAAGVLSSLQDDSGFVERILDGVHWAEWHPKNCSNSSSLRQCLAVVRDVAGRNRLEYPIGTVLYETGGWISHPRFSPSGNYLAFIDHQTPADDSGAVTVIDLPNAGNKRRVLSDKWVSIQGLAWKPTGDEIWFTAAKSGNARSIFAVSLQSERVRPVFRGIGSLTLHDFSLKGDALVTVNRTRVRIAARITGEAEERDLSWHDWSLVRDLSRDGKTILFTEAGESSGEFYSTYIRGIDGSDAVRLGDGSALALSPGGKHALVKLFTTPGQLGLLSTKGDGPVKQLQPLKGATLNYHPWACWFPEGDRILFAANQEGSGTRLYVQELDGTPECITPDIEGVELSSPSSISPAGDLLAMTMPDNKICIYSIENKKIVNHPKIQPNYLPVRWNESGKYLFVRERGAIPAVIYRHQLSSGVSEALYELMPKEKKGVHEILRVLLAPDTKSCFYSYTQDLSDLLIIEGLH